MERFRALIRERSLLNAWRFDWFFCFAYQLYSFVCEQHFSWNGRMKNKGQRVNPRKRFTSLSEHGLMEQDNALLASLLFDSTLDKLSRPLQI